MHSLICDKWKSLQWAVYGPFAQYLSIVLISVEVLEWFIEAQDGTTRIIPVFIIMCLPIKVSLLSLCNTMVSAHACLYVQISLSPLYFPV